jgi:RNA polymerase sigma factor (TIGR02999 family)
MISGHVAGPGDPAPDRQRSVATLLDDLRHGRREALDELFPLVYDELRELAHRQRARWKGDDTLNTTALVHEAYLKLVDQRRATWESQAHFLAAAARAIRHVLINYARDRRAQKRGGGWQRVSLDEHQLAGGGETVGPSWEDRVLALDEALQRLAGWSERQSRIIECRFFGGMTVQQTAHALGVSVPTVTRGWTMARAWLHRELNAGPTAPGT